MLLCKTHAWELSCCQPRKRLSEVFGQCRNFCDHMKLFRVSIITQALEVLFGKLIDLYSINHVHFFIVYFPLNLDEKICGKIFHK